MSDVATLLERAAARITPATWCQHVLGDGDGRFCAVGHLGQARAELDLPMAVEWEALTVLELTGCGPNLSVWNDMPLRTAHHVRAAFEHAARCERPPCLTTA